ncbi:hypothetical protein BDV27DRAFT_147260 [Aspergillus caelatus]|uniref:Uncharacterized protein n=1 Tax=Aspergillus caelatus TaxID=61420 RepID=A0A5N6ZX47_9EURO|nr:uncharacterized protein BDV27DRAFT_147260 [Aspergillus caelatus]KAE8362092.1 hypothetical protein BDV27DRAFT_147260 [Aspergillus caelatus]
MAVVLGRKIRKLIVGVALSVVGFAILQFSYTDDFAFSEHLPGSLQILDDCSPNALERTNNPRPVVGFAIPNIVHLIWKTTDVQEYSTEITASRASWRATLEPSNYTVKIWADDDVLELIKANYTWLLPTYNEYPHDIQRADLARLLIVHTEHLQCLQTLGLQAIFSRTAGTLGLSNHFFMAKPGSPFLRWVLYEAKRRSSRLASRGMILPYLQVFWSTGPIMVTAAFRQYAWLHNTLPLDIGLLDHGFGGTVVRHAAGRSWQWADGGALNYIADHAGIGTMLRAVAYFFTVVGLIYMVMRCKSRFTR